MPAVAHDSSGLERSGQSRSTAGTGAVFALLALLLVLGPLYWGGNRPEALLVLLPLSIMLMAIWALSPQARQVPRRFILAIVALPMVALLQLVPLSPTLWSSLPGRDVFLDAAAALNMGNLPWLPVSLVPAATFDSLINLLLPVAVFLAVATAAPDAQRKLLIVMLAMCAIQAVFATLQFIQGPKMLPWGELSTGNANPAGTYASRNHLAGMLELGLGGALGLLIAGIQPGQRFAGRNSLAHRMARWWNTNFDHVAAFGSVTVLVLLGLVFSQSRAGFVLMLLGLLLAAVVLRPKAGAGARRVAAGVIVVAMLVTLAFDRIPVIDRLLDQDALADSRWPIFASTAEGAVHLMPFGSGLGTYPLVYPRFQPDAVSGLVNHSHNDYLELVFETGVLGVVLLLIGVVAFSRRWNRVMAAPHGERHSGIRKGAGVGLALFLLHGLVDFNLHIPANAMYFALLAGVFFSDPVKLAPAADRARRRSRHRHQPVSIGMPTAQIENPFKDDD